MGRMLHAPKGEQIWKQYFDRNHEPRFFITSKQDNREWYYLYEVAPDGYKKLGKAKSPPDLEEKYRVLEVCST